MGEPPVAASFAAYVSMKYGMDIRDLWKKRKIGTYNNPRPKYIPNDATGKVQVSITDIKEWGYLYHTHHDAKT